MAQRMPPPGPSNKKPGLVIAVGVPKGASGKGNRMPPPGLDHVEEHDTAAPGAAGEGAKATREKALVIPDDHHCKDCANWTPETGECAKVEGNFSPDAACLRYFGHLNAEDEQNGDDEGAEEVAQPEKEGNYIHDSLRPREPS